MSEKWVALIDYSARANLKAFIYYPLHIESMDRFTKKPPHERWQLYRMFEGVSEASAWLCSSEAQEIAKSILDSQESVLRNCIKCKQPKAIEEFRDTYSHKVNICNACTNAGQKKAYADKKAIRDAKRLIRAEGHVKALREKTNLRIANGEQYE